jgi:hypothetical protein
MDRKIWIYVGLIVVVLAGMGLGIGLGMSKKDDTKANPVTIPEGKPMISMDINNPEAKTLTQVFVYEDGTVIHAVDSAAALPVTAGDTFTRTWRTGTITSGEIDSLFAYLESVGFDDIEYAFVSSGAEGNVVQWGAEDYIRISAENSETDNIIAAIGYLEADSTPYSELPEPVGGIYEKLAEIIAETQQALVEELTK